MLHSEVGSMVVSGFVVSGAVVSGTVVSVVVTVSPWAARMRPVKEIETEVARDFLKKLRRFSCCIGEARFLLCR